MVAQLEKPLIAIVGPTASGKTNVAIRIAEQFGGEIICADSRTIYKYADIGTAKPTPQEQKRVAHWGLDLVEPNERYSVSDYQSYALAKIAEIRERGNVPLLVGGTGLYADSVLFNFGFDDEPADEWRKALEPNTHVVGIATSKQVLRQRIEARTEQLFDNGVVEEATILGKKYGWDSPAMTGNIYRIAHAYLENRFSYEDARKKFTTLDWQLAKRQMTWLRPNPYIEWCSLEETYHYCSKLLASV